MQPHAVPGQPWQATVFPILIFVVVIGLRWRRLSRPRPLKLELLWIFPALYAVIAAAMFFEFPPSLAGWGCFLLALAVGGAIGWQRGRMMRIEVDPETHRLSQRGSPAALFLLVGLVLLRNLGRYELSGLGQATMLVTDAGLGLGLGLIAATRLEMGLRAKRLLAEARRA
jgi:hypothetical protein